MTENLSFPFFSKLSKVFGAKLSELMSLVQFQEGEPVVNQYEVGEYFYLMLEGKVEFSIKIDLENEALKVGESDAVYTPVGWSGFREPYRYATTVSCLQDTSFAKWSHRDLKLIFEEDPSSAQEFLSFIVCRSQMMLQDSREVLAHYAHDTNESFLDLDLFKGISKNAGADSVSVLKRSPFFEVFSKEEVIALAHLGAKKSFGRGEKVYQQGNISSGFDVLVEGKVALIYTSETNDAKLDKRIISNEGYIIGSGAFTESGVNDVTCVALRDSRVLHIDLESLTAYLRLHPITGKKFYLRLLWFISNRLRSARARLITIKYDGEILAVKNLIEQNCTQLSIVSELHKIPHLLGHTYTLGDAIVKLQSIKENGTTLEVSLANSSLEILTNVVKEHEFYNGLSNLYHEVVHAPKELSHFEVRKLCAERFIEVFDKTNFILKGEENLPEEPAIYIYNHLENHVFNTFPNNFQLTLDSHFISSEILYRHYGDPGIRVVRVPKSNEYGHQYYYERLGHIPVYTADSASIDETKEEKEKRRLDFYKQASQYLENGTSIMLAPEGQSFTTSVSPGAFRFGAFRLPAFMKKEPYIVPVVMANFDKRLGQKTFVAVIKKPFKISEKVSDIHDKETMKAFVDEYRKEYRGYVKEAAKLSRNTNWKTLVE